MVSENLGEHFADVADVWVDQYRTSPSFRSRLVRVGRLIDRYLPESGTVLDYGCGPGIFSMVASARARWVAAVDVSLPMLRAEQGTLTSAIDIAREAGTEPRPERISRMAGTLGSVRPMIASFDLVVAIAVLEYVEDPVGHAAMLGGLLRPGGTLIITLPDPQSIFRRIETPVNRIARRTGQLLGQRRLIRREYSLLRPDQIGSRWWLDRQPWGRLLETEKLPLGELGWRSKVSPSVAAVLQRTASSFGNEGGDDGAVTRTPTSATTSRPEEGVGVGG
jgi:SAM-dependent methyltransferase